MGWIKRNLIFVISSVLALGLLGVGGFLIYRGWSTSSEASDQLKGIYDQLAQITQSPLQPGDDRTDNVKLAKEQEQQLRDWINKAGRHFSPIAPIPQGEVTSKTYATALGATIYQLQQEAKENSVGLPSQYYFSFQVQSSKLAISSGLEPLAQQLGEVKTIAEILYAARVNDLDGIQRVRVSDDDVSGGLQSDYIEAYPITNSLAIITPYMVTFRGFTPELAKVISGFATASNSFVVKSISVQPVSAAASPDTGVPQGPQGPQGGPAMPPGRFGYPGMPGGYPAPGVSEQPNQPMSAKGGLQTVLKEQLLRVTMEVDIIKLLKR